jgi:hypothetical protein
VRLSALLIAGELRMYSWFIVLSDLRGESTGITMLDASDAESLSAIV